VHANLSINVGGNITSTSAEDTISEDVSGKVPKSKDGLVWHSPGAIIDIDGDVDGATAATGLWIDNLIDMLKSFRLQVVLPGEPAIGGKVYDAFDIEGEGMWLIRAMQKRILVNDPSIASDADDEPIRVSIFLPFALDGRDTFWPNVIPIARIKTATLVYDASKKHDNTTVNNNTVSLRFPIVKAVSEQPYVPVSWVQRTGYGNQKIESPAELVQSAFVLNTKAGNANKYVEVTADVLELDAAPGPLLLSRWIDMMGFTDVNDDVNLDAPEVVCDYVHPLLDAAHHGPSSGVRGPITWTFDANSPASATVLWRTRPGA